MNPPTSNQNHRSKLSRARGCLVGQIAEDALGSLVEFLSPLQISRRYPQGVRELADGGTWNTLAGQPTDDSEMALLLARMLSERGACDPNVAPEAYQFWRNSQPFDCGMTTASGLRGRPNAAICGALLGAVYGVEAIPSQWIDRLLSCRPKAGRLNVRQPRPECFWPEDVLDLAERLVRSNE